MSSFVDILRYPFQRSPFYLLLATSVIGAFLSWGAEYGIGFTALLATVMLIGVEVSVYFFFVRKAAYGQSEFQGPDFVSSWDDLLMPVFRYLVAALPLIVGIIWLGQSLGSTTDALTTLLVSPGTLLHYTGPAAMIIVGFAVLPLTTVVAAMTANSWDVLNPFHCAKILRGLGPKYLVGAAFFYLVLLFEALLWGPALRSLQETIDIPFVTRFVVYALAFLPSIYRARALGGMCEPHLRD